MKGTFITSTERGHMHPLAVQGILVTHCHTQITNWVRDHLDEEHSLLFAEPVFDEARDVVDWYTELPGPVTAIASLEPEAQERALQQMGEQARAINAAVHGVHAPSKAGATAEPAIPGEKGAVGQSTSAVSAEIVQLALHYPGMQCLYQAGGKPVLVAWGYGPPTAGAEPQDLTRAGTAVSSLRATKAEASTPAPVAASSLPPPREAAAGGSGWLSWLLVLLLLLLLLPLLWALITKNIPCLFEFFGCSLPGDNLEHMRAAEDRDKNLKQDLQRVLKQVRERKARCVAVTAQQPVPPTSTVTSVPKPASPKAVSPKATLELPEKPVQDDMRFIEGEWVCDTGLQNTSGDPVVVLYVFDAKGKGSLALTDGMLSCTSSATARMEVNELHIVTDPEIVCSSGQRYTGQRIQCSGFGSQTLCQGQNMSDGARWDASFVRK